MPPKVGKSTSTSHKRFSRAGNSNPPSTPSRFSNPEQQFSHVKLKEWQKDKNPGKLQLEEPKYYSTTSGFDSNGDVIPRQLVQDEKANMKLLKADMIQSTLPTPLNLEEGEIEMKNYRSKERMDILLEGLIKHGVVGSSKFVCQRGLLICVGRTPYSFTDKNDKDKKIAVERINSTIYMYMYPSDSSKPRNDQQNQNVKLYIGFKFEQLLTEKSDESSSSVSDRSLEFGALVKAKLGDHELIISGEVDCVDGNGDLVELKTSLYDIESLNFKKRTKWWLQCYLLGVKTMVVGKHDMNHKCTGVRRLPVPSDTPVVPQNLTDWIDKPMITTSQIMLAAIHKFLTIVDEKMKYISSTGPTKRNICLFERKAGFSSFSFSESTVERDRFLENVMIKRLVEATPPAPSVSSSVSSSSV